MTRTSSVDYEQLCSLDMLGLEDRADRNQQCVHEEFKEQLRQNTEGWYEMGFTAETWAQIKPIPNNKQGSLRRLENLGKKLRRELNLLAGYDSVIQDQLVTGIVERVTSEPVGGEFYIPYKPVIRQSAESTKLRIVYDASAKANEKSPSVNDCLEKGPSLQNLHWDVLVHNCLKPITLAGDLKQAFLQVRIRAGDRDILRFHWFKDTTMFEVEVLRFTRALFGLVQSPVLLGGTMQYHLQSLNVRYPKKVDEILKGLYVTSF